MTYINASRIAGIAHALALALALPAWAQTGPQPRLPTEKLGIGMSIVNAEIARTPDQQQTGMMFRTTMGDHEGMLFVNDDIGTRCFWMRNTLIPLSIAFIADDGTIVNIDEMQPKTDDSHCSAKPVRYVLEMPKGWFAKRNITAGTKVRGPMFRP